MALHVTYYPALFCATRCQHTDIAFAMIASPGRITFAEAASLSARRRWGLDTRQRVTSVIADTYSSDVLF